MPRRRARLCLISCGVALAAAFMLSTARDAGAQDRRTASEVFGAVEGPVMLPPRSIGFYSRGCLVGAERLTDDEPHLQTMRPSRNRAWGHPHAIDFVRSLAERAVEIGLNGLLVGDLSQPRGGPMPYGHASHQVGLDVDIWLTEMPQTRLNLEERETLPLTSVVGPDGYAEPERLTPAFRQLIKVTAQHPRTARIFVNPVIKQALCDTAGSDRAWLRRVRPWYGHDKHFHVRLKCPASSPGCRRQAPPPPGDGCGAELGYWFTPEPYEPQPQRKARGPLTVSQLPPVCAKIVRQRLPRPRPVRSSQPDEAPIAADPPLAQAPAGTGQETPVPPSPQ